MRVGIKPDAFNRPLGLRCGRPGTERFEVVLQPVELRQQDIVIGVWLRKSVRDIVPFGNQARRGAHAGHDGFKDILVAV